MLPPTVVVQPAKRGRPTFASGDTPPADVHLTMAPEDYDHAYRIAARDRISVQEVLRRALKRLIQDESGGSISVSLGNLK
jgi:hypothetical protein